MRAWASAHVGNWAVLHAHTAKALLSVQVADWTATDRFPYRFLTLNARPPGAPRTDPYQTCGSCIADGAAGTPPGYFWNCLKSPACQYKVGASICSAFSPSLDGVWLFRRLMFEIHSVPRHRWPRDSWRRLPLCWIPPSGRCCLHRTHKRMRRASGNRILISLSSPPILRVPGLRGSLPIHYPLFHFPFYGVLSQSD